MRSKRRFGITALTAAIALGIGAIPVVMVSGALPSTGTASVVTPAAFPDSPGWLALTTGATDSIVLDWDGDGVAEATQQLTEPGDCKLGSLGDPLIAFSGYVGTSDTAGTKASFASNSLGVAEKKSGVSCYQVSAGSNATAERLALDFGSQPIAAADIDVELKSGARILATALRNDAVVGYFELHSGSSIGKGKWSTGDTSGKPHVLFKCNNPADSGPDSGINDNCRWPLSGPSWRDTKASAASDPYGESDASLALTFDRLELKALAGSFSIEGGTDGEVFDSAGAPGPVAANGGHASIFELGGLDCGDTTGTLLLSGTAPGATVRRLENADPLEECVGVRYSLTHDANSALFLKPGIQTSAQFVFDMVWSQPGDALAVTTQTVVNFHPDGDPSADRNLKWCPDPIIENGVLNGIDNPLGPAIQAQDMFTSDTDDDGSIQFACVGTQEAVVDTLTDTVIVHEQIYMLGDVALRK